MIAMAFGGYAVDLKYLHSHLMSFTQENAVDLYSVGRVP